MTENRHGGKRSDSVCVLVSGGIDSCVLLVQMAKRYQKVVPVYIRNGLHWEEAELYWLRQFLERVTHSAIQPLRVLELPMGDVYQSHWSLTGQGVPDQHTDSADVYLPGRNLILFCKTAVFCALNGIQVIALAPLKGNPFTDSSSAFLAQFRKTVEQGLKIHLKILTPFSKRGKAWVLRLGRRLPLEATFSCLRPQRYMHCGVCNKCAERINGFKEAGLADRTTYHQDKFVGKTVPFSTNGGDHSEAQPKRTSGRHRPVRV